MKGLGGLALCWALLWAGPSAGQNHPELKWEVVESEHFRIYYYPGLEAAAQRAMAIAEDDLPLAVTPTIARIGVGGG